MSTVDPLPPPPPTSLLPVPAMFDHLSPPVALPLRLLRAPFANILNLAHLPAKLFQHTTDIIRLWNSLDAKLECKPLGGGHTRARTMGLLLHRLAREEARDTPTPEALPCLTPSTEFFTMAAPEPDADLPSVMRTVAPQPHHMLDDWGLPMQLRRLPKRPILYGASPLNDVFPDAPQNPLLDALQSALLSPPLNGSTPALATAPRRRTLTRRTHLMYNTQPPEEFLHHTNSHLDKTDLVTLHVPNDVMPRILELELVRALSGSYANRFDDIRIVDCRFKYEYDGGHIDGAINVGSQREVEELLHAAPAHTDINHPVFPEMVDADLDLDLSDDELHGTRSRRLLAHTRRLSTSLAGSRQAVVAPSAPRTTLMVFHCEFLLHRGPTMAAHLRKMDRLLNRDNYPYLTYPDIVVLEGGYQRFFAAHKTLCFPPAYVEMNHPEFKDVCRLRMDLFRSDTKKKPLMRAKTFHFANHSEPPAAVPQPSRLKRQRLNLGAQRTRHVHNDLLDNISVMFDRLSILHLNLSTGLLLAQLLVLLLLSRASKPPPARLRALPTPESDADVVPRLDFGFQFPAPAEQLPCLLRRSHTTTQ